MTGFASLVVALIASAAPAAIPVWPLSGTTGMHDSMHTSFGPRVNYGSWDLHDGIDLPAAIGTTCYAVLPGTIFRAADAGFDSYDNRHVVLRSIAPDGATLYINYLHLSAIALTVTVGASVNQGDVIGYVGDDAATYPHLHFETRWKNNFEVSSRHPLHWFAYDDTANFTVPVNDRVAEMAPGDPAVRVRFGAPDREEGDLARVSVAFFNGATPLGLREVNLDDKTTVQEGNDESLMFTNDLALEGYQSSNMTLYGFPDLHYGLLIRNLPAGTDAVTVRVVDIAGRTVTGAALPVTPPAATDVAASFEDGALPPAGWATVTSTGMSSIQVTPAAARAGALGLRCTDANAGLSFPEFAGVEIPIPAGRFEWVAEGWVRPLTLSRSAPSVIYPMAVLSGTTVAAAVWMWDTGTQVATGLVAREFSTSLTGTVALSTGALGGWRHLRMTLRRLGTRQATITLDVDGVRAGFLNWDARSYEPDAFRAGVALSAGGLATTVDVDGLRLTEYRDPAFPDLAPPGSAAPPPAPFGAGLADVTVRPTAIRPGDGISCVTASRLPPGTTAEIFTRSGRRVRTLPPSSAGTERWCLTDDGGADLPSGIYLIALRDPGGNRRTVKLALVR